MRYDLIPPPISQTSVFYHIELVIKGKPESLDDICLISQEVLGMTAFRYLDISMNQFDK